MARPPSKDQPFQDPILTAWANPLVLDRSSFLNSDMALGRSFHPLRTSVTPVQAARLFVREGITLLRAEIGQRRVLATLFS